MPCRWFLSASTWAAIAGALSFATSVLAESPAQTEPRIANIFNFCRNTDFRAADSEKFLLQATAEEIKLVHSKHLVGTWALQYDALINPDYQKLMKEQLTGEDEIAGWLEIPRQLVEKAGLKWRGSNDWDPTCRVDYAPAYAPEDRQKLIDIYMADFKSIFGHYPRTVGAWYIDETTLAYMVQKYGIVASCNCQDRVRPEVNNGTTTLWGGYWNQAYYPSKLNAYMPAQTKQGQIDVPIFRMLGSDPIYQYPRIPAVYAMEAAYSYSGGSTKWVDWYFRNMIAQPSLAFAYVQVGQENSFGWDIIKQGLTHQVSVLCERAAAGEIRVETMEKTGEWFKSKYELTPATAVVCLDDWRYQGRKSVWYDSRYYRVNLLWDKNGLVIRDLHRFDQSKVSEWHDAAMTSPALACATLPIVEGTLWATKRGDACAIPVQLSSDGKISPFIISGDPSVSQAGVSELTIIQPLKGGGAFTITCSESSIRCSAVDAAQHPVAWAWELHGGSAQAKAITGMTDTEVDFNFDHFQYALKLREGSFRTSSDGLLQIQATENGQLALQLE